MNTSLLKYSDVKLHEFDPMVNPRSHLMKTEKSNILNK